MTMQFAEIFIIWCSHAFNVAWLLFCVGCCYCTC